MGTWVKENDPNDHIILNTDGTCLYRGSPGSWDIKPSSKENPSELIFTIPGNETVSWYYWISNDNHYLGLYPPESGPSILYERQ